MQDAAAAQYSESVLEASSYLESLMKIALWSIAKLAENLIYGFESVFDEGSLD